MKPDLQQLVDTWSNQNFIHETKLVDIAANPNMHNELRLVLKVYVRVTVGAQSEDIEMFKLFYTLENGAEGDTSKGDCYRFHQATSKFDIAFSDKYEETLEKLINDQFPDGFTLPG